MGTKLRIVYAWYESKAPRGYAIRKKTICQKTNQTDEDMITMARKMADSHEYAYVYLLREFTTFKMIPLFHGTGKIGAKKHAETE